MTSKTDFTDTEWEALRRAPMVAGMAISLADPGGPIEVMKETSAVMRLVSEELGDTGLVGDVARDLAEMVQQRQNPIGGFKPAAAKEITGELARVNGIVTAKATPEEAAQFRTWLLDSARRAADAAKEGGFLGFKAVRVSEGEQRMLDEIAAALDTAS
jgi:hypothetical protein